MEAKMMIAGSFDEFVEKITQAERKALFLRVVYIASVVRVAAYRAPQFFLLFCVVVLCYT